MWITDLYTEKAVERIQNHNSSVPLFLYLAFQAPHSPIPRPPDKYMSEYKGFRSVYQAGLPNGSQAIHRAAAVTAMDIGVGKVVEMIEMLTKFLSKKFKPFQGGGRPQSRRHLRELCDRLHHGQRRSGGQVVQLSFQGSQGVALRGRSSGGGMGS